MTSVASADIGGLLDGCISYLIRGLILTGFRLDCQNRCLDCRKTLKYIAKVQIWI